MSWVNPGKGLPGLPPGVSPENYAKGSVIQQALIKAIVNLLAKRQAPLVLAVGACCRVAGRLGADCNVMDRQQFMANTLQVMMEEYDAETQRRAGAHG